jgi:lipid A 4'-phosphatase
MDTASLSPPHALATARMSADLRLIAYVLLATVGIVTAISLVGPNVDLAVTRLLFADPATGQFPSSRFIYRFGFDYRDNGLIALTVCLICIGLSLANFLPWKLPVISLRMATYLTTAYLLGPGLLVNVILKTYSGRPRPIGVLDFGGTLPFVNWWDPTGACQHQCSFVSGEGAAAAWLIGPALIVPAPWRVPAIGLATAFFLYTGTIRMATGGHFLTDVLMAGLSSVLILLFLRPIFFPKNPGQ